MGTKKRLQQKHLLFVVVLWAACVLCSCHVDKPAPGYDYFTLSLQWPYAYCKEEYVTCRPDPPEQDYFTIHGLWPTNIKGQNPRECEGPAVTDDIFTEFKDRLLKYWPKLNQAKNFDYSKTFWKNQWLDHGTCSSNKFPPRDYFERGLDLGEKYSGPLFKALQDGDIKPDGTTTYTSAKVLEAIKAGTNKNAVIRCSKDKAKSLQLSEVHLCFDADAQQLRDCTRSSTCDDPFIFASPPSKSSPSSHTLFLGSVSSIWKDEEAAGL